MTVKTIVDTKGRERHMVEFELRGKRVFRRLPVGSSLRHAEDLERGLRTRLVDKLIFGQPDPLPEEKRREFRAWAKEAVVDARARCKRRGMEHCITVELILGMMESRDYRCAVTGLQFSTEKPPGAHKRPFMPSIDRIDASRGYTPDNVRVVCIAVNLFIRDWGDGMFATMARAYIATAK